MMTDKKKMGAGMILHVITVIVTAVGLFLYLQNCKTSYFSNMGVNTTVVACLAASAVLEILMIVLSLKMGAKPFLDIIPVACGVMTALAAIQFIGSRIAGAASIMTFENNAENMADLNGAITAMAVCVIALVCVWITSFFKVVKE
ncbi:MAG: hypothetical protein Q4C77_07270 [Eubacteriales bacterium]|nr:hypothetical protein [Eubacteriales bacterium]